MKEGASPEVLKARESRGKPRVGRVRGSGPCRGVIERPGGSRHDSDLESITRKGVNASQEGETRKTVRQGTEESCKTGEQGKL